MKNRWMNMVAVAWMAGMSLTVSAQQLSLSGDKVSFAPGETVGIRYEGAASGDKILLYHNLAMLPLKEKGVDCVFRYTDEGRIYGATFIDHRTHCVLNGSRMGKAFSANALEQHFNTPPEEQIPFKEKEEQEEQPNTGSTSAEGQQHSTSHNEQEHYESKGGFASFLDALDILNTDNPVTDVEEEAFRRRLQRKKKRCRGPRL